MPNAADWCYPSGVVAVLEMYLLPPRVIAEFDGSVAELLSRVHHNPVYAHIQASDDPLAVASALETALVEFVRRFVRECPVQEIADVFLAEYDFRDLGNHLKSRYCGIERRPVALSRIPADGAEALIANHPSLAGATAAVGAAAAATGDRLRPEFVDLILDGALIAALPELVRPLQSELIDIWAALRQRLLAMEAAFRAKLQNVAESDIERYLFPVQPDAEQMSRNGQSEIRDLRAVMDLSGRHAADLARVLEPARAVVFGPERVFRYLWDLFCENRNLRARLAGLAGGIEQELVVVSMRGIDG